MKVAHSDSCPLSRFQWTTQSWKNPPQQCLDGVGADVSPTVLPCSRVQHACCHQGHYVYFYGGKDRYSPLRDFWRLDIGTGKWEEIVMKDTKIPHLQGHTMIAYKSQIFIFGGTFEETPEDTPLWIYNYDLQYVRKYVCESSVHPMGRREHSAVVYKNSMYIYGGFLDSSGSTDELWEFNMEEEEWYQWPRPKSGKRHGHVSVVHHNEMWTHGGMKGLGSIGDLWIFNFSLCTWKRLKGIGTCPALSYHTAHIIDNSILFVGGSNNSSPSSAIWVYGIDNNTWHQIEVDQGHLFTPVFLHTSALIDPKTPDKKSENHSQSTPHLKSRSTETVIPSVRPWTSPSPVEGHCQSQLTADAYSSEVNVLNLESIERVQLDKNNNSEENIFSRVEPMSSVDKAKVRSDFTWVTFHDKENVDGSSCEVFEMSDLPLKRLSNNCTVTKIRPSSGEHCLDDLPLLQRFRSVSSDADLGESNAVMTLSDENICEKMENCTIQGEDSFQYDNAAFSPTFQSAFPFVYDNVRDFSSLEGALHFAKNNLHSIGHLPSLTETAEKNYSLPTLHNKYKTVELNQGLMGKNIMETSLIEGSLISLDGKRDSFQDCDGLVDDKGKRHHSCDDLVLEDLESHDDINLLEDLTLACPSISSMKCQSLKDVSSSSCFNNDKNFYSSSHPFYIDSPRKGCSKSCSSLNAIGIKNKLSCSSFNDIESICSFLLSTIEDKKRKPVIDINLGRASGKYIKHQTYSSNRSACLSEAGKHCGHSNLQKMINFKKSAATQTGSQSSLTGRDSNYSVCKSSKQNSQSNNMDQDRSRSTSTGSDVINGYNRLNAFSDCKFILFVFGGQTEMTSFIKTPLKIWKCKVL